MKNRTIDVWFTEWMAAHQDACPGDWPDASVPKGHAFYMKFYEAMRRLNIDEPLALDATNAIAGRPDPGHDRYLDEVLEYAQAIRKAERDAENLRLKARRQELLARWDAMPEAERAPIRDRVLAAHPWTRTLERALRLICAESFDDPTLLEPTPTPAPQLRLVVPEDQAERVPSKRRAGPACKPMSANG